MKPHLQYMDIVRLHQALSFVVTLLLLKRSGMPSEDGMPVTAFNAFRQTLYRSV
jgi:hypothetical protein